MKSFCLTPDRKHLITFEELADQDSHKDIRMQALKFWHRETVEEDLSGFQVTWLIHNPCQSNDDGLKIEAIDNKNIVIINALSKIQLWTYSETTKRWIIQAEVNYQDLAVVQVIPNIKFRIHTVEQAKKTLAILHKNGQLTFWDQETFALQYTFKLNNPSKKVVFESSMRYLASLTQDGAVEVWKVKGKSEAY